MERPMLVICCIHVGCVRNVENPKLNWIFKDIYLQVKMVVGGTLIGSKRLGPRQSNIVGYAKSTTVDVSSRWSDDVVSTSNDNG